MPSAGISELTAALLGRERPFLAADLDAERAAITAALADARVLVIGAAGSIGSSFAVELARFRLGGLHLLDISENNLVEVVRQLRSGGAALPDDFRTFALDFTAAEMAALLAAERYDYVLNFSALKHVRSERDPFTLMRLLQVNVCGNARLLDTLAERQPDVRRVFSVSSDKAVRPANLMGASKAFMERIFLARADQLPTSSARFANVAFSDGSLLHSFRHRLEKGQPISAPGDVRRYFISHEEAGQLCLLACFAGGNREVFFPKFRAESDMMSFADIARLFLEHHGLEARECAGEAEALRRMAEHRPGDRWWPCLFTTSDTSGEKPYEEFCDPSEQVDTGRYRTVGVVTHPVFHGRAQLDEALAEIGRCRARGSWSKAELVAAVQAAVPELAHVETERNLDQKM